MPDYTYAKVYIIRAPGTDDVYIGSTTNRYLCRRLAQHRFAYKQWVEGKHHYCWSFKMLEQDNHFIELLEKVECNTIEELRKREGELIRTTPNCINWYIAGRTTAEYQEEHKEQLQAYRAAWYKTKKERKKQEV